MSKKKKKLTENSLPIEKIVWKDHFSSQLKSGWQGADLDITPVVVTSVGHKVVEDKEVVALSQNADQSGTHGNVIAILKNCIISRKTL